MRSHFCNAGDGIFMCIISYFIFAIFSGVYKVKVTGVKQVYMKKESIES